MLEMHCAWPYRPGKAGADMRTVLGLDRLEEFEGIFRGKRIGLITNYSGVDSLWRVNVDLFMDRGLRIGKLFTPEHGMFDTAGSLK